jgi:1,2-phenylacetyl-CoA epoxidase PaaB subunit
MAKKSSKTSAKTSAKQSSKQSSKPGEVAWIVTRLTGTPARYVGRVFAANEADAIQRAIDEFRIRNPEMQKKLSARRET